MDARNNGPRRSLSALVCALFVFSAIAAEPLYAQGRERYGDGPPPREVPPREGRPPPGHQEGGSSRGNEWVPWAIIGVIGAVAVASAAKEANANVDENALAANGPRFPDSYTVGTFAVQGYFSGGWPIVVDFTAHPDTCTWLEVSFDQKLRYYRLLDLDGRGGRRLVRVEVPPAYAPGPRAAVYVVRSVHPMCPPAPAVPADNATPSPVEVYAIGAGPHAVGSVAIDELQFGPEELRYPKDRAAIAYRAQSEFNHASVEILHYNQEPSGQIDVSRVTAKTASVSPGQNRGDPWDGNNESGSRSMGVHRLQVRAWSTESDQSWVGAISPTSVTVVQ